MGVLVALIAVYVMSGLAFFTRTIGRSSRNRVDGMGSDFQPHFAVAAHQMERMVGVDVSGSIRELILAIIWQVKLLNVFGKNGAYVLFGIFLNPVYAILWLVWAYSSDTKYRLVENRSDNLNYSV